MKYRSGYFNEAVLEYIDGLAKKLDRSRNWILQQLLEKAVDLHQKGDLKI